jgi:hypothetical protein
MARAKTTTREEDIVVSEIRMTEMRFNLVGVTPLVPHSMSAHAKGQLLYPPPKKNAAERASTMKHNPYEEYRAAAYRFTNDEINRYPLNSPQIASRAARLYMPAGSIHSALKDVAIDMIGAKKAQVGRLTSVPGLKLPLFGVPMLFSTPVRSSDQKRTPDIRILPILPQWAIPGIVIRFVGSLIKEASIANLLGNAGIIIGIGDGRQQKGYFDYGSWRLAADDDKELRQIIAQGGVKAQDAALDDPAYYDLETRQLMEWFEEEKKRRAAGPPTSARTGKSGRVAVHAPQLGRRARAGNGRRQGASTNG